MANDYVLMRSVRLQAGWLMAGSYLDANDSRFGDILRAGGVLAAPPGHHDVVLHAAERGQTMKLRGASQEDIDSVVGSVGEAMCIVLGATGEYQCPGFPIPPPPGPCVAAPNPYDVPSADPAYVVMRGARTATESYWAGDTLTLTDALRAYALGAVLCLSARSSVSLDWTRNSPRAKRRTPQWEDNEALALTIRQRHIIVINGGRSHDCGPPGHFHARCPATPFLGSP